VLLCLPSPRATKIINKQFLKIFKIRILQKMALCWKELRGPTRRARASTRLRPCTDGLQAPRYTGPRATGIGRLFANLRAPFLKGIWQCVRVEKVTGRCARTDTASLAKKSTVVASGVFIEFQNLPPIKRECPPRRANPRSGKIQLVSRPAPFDLKKLTSFFFFWCIATHFSLLTCEGSNARLAVSKINLARKNRSSQAA